jgi:hypothetical protein
MESEALTAELRTELKPEIEALEQAAYERGKAEGATTERQRIKGVREALMPGQEALVEQLMWDGKTAPAEAAQRVLAAEKERRQKTLSDLKADAPSPVPHADAPGTEEQQTTTASAATVEQARKAGLVR